jgi:DNA-binding LacI/PurR family transcriptional regulator
MSPTIRDVASKASVSFQLAAAVLGRRKYAHASESTRKRIFSAAEELGYVPNASARILRGKASKILGVLIDSRSSESMFSFLAEFEQTADAFGYRILTAQAHDNPEKLMSSYSFLKQNGVDGIISLSHDYSQLGCRLDQRFPDDPKIVFVFNTDERNPSAVDIDIKSAIVTAAEHLRSRGYCKTALVLHGNSDPDKQPASCRKRMEGFRLGCPDGQVFFLPTSVNELNALEKESCRLLREKLIPGRFDSVISVNDLTAVILMNQLLSQGIRIPQDFGVVGCDDLPIGACYPVKLTTIGYDREKMARSVLQLMMDKIAGNIQPARVTFPMELIIRESTNRQSERERSVR